MLHGKQFTTRDLPGKNNIALKEKELFFVYILRLSQSAGRINALIELICQAFPNLLSNGAYPSHFYNGMLTRLVVIKRAPPPSLSLNNTSS